MHQVLTKHWLIRSQSADFRSSLLRWKKFLSYYRPHMWMLAGDLACAFVIAVTTLALPLCANYVMGRLPQIGKVPSLLGQIYAIGGAMLVLFAIQALCTLFVDYQGHVMGAKMEGSMRRELFAHYQKLPFAFYDERHVGQLMSRISNDLLSLAELYHHGPEDLAIATLKFTGALIILFQLDAPLTLIIVALLPFAAAYSLYFSARMNEALRRSKERIAAISERVEDSLLGIRVVKSFANEQLEIGRFEEENGRFLSARRLGYKSEAFLSVGLSTFGQLITLVVIVVGAARIVHSSLSVAGLLTYLLCVAILIDPIERLVNFVRLWQEGLTGFTRFMELLEEEPESENSFSEREIKTVRGAVSFKKVSFRYSQGDRFVLRNLSLEIRAGEFVALTGYSGVGKTTLGSLIPRFYEATAGKIEIDGTDVREIKLASLRQNIGFVQQDVYLFAGTVADNLRYGRPEATETELIAAAKHAHAHDFIMSLPQTYQTDIGQRGIKLSGGQRQQLTIARVFLEDPQILIFDEATSALDNESENAIQAALNELSSGRTTIVIAHRLSTVRRADRILVLTDEGIAEQGSHDSLLAIGGIYAGLCQAQASI